MTMQVKEMPTIRVAGVRHVGSFRGLGAAFQRLGEIAGASGLFGREGVVMMGIFHDHPETVPESELRSDAAVSLPADAELPGGLAEQHLPGGRYAHLVHEGSYEGLAETWGRLMAAIRAGGHQVTGGPSYERYLNTPAEVPESELRTELYVPIR